MLSAALWSAGLLLIGIAVVDIFGVVLQYDGQGRATMRLTRVTWTSLRWTAERFSGERRRQLLLLGVPLTVVATVAMWAALFTLGFALLHYDGFRHEAYTFATPLSPGFGEAVYLSMMTLATLGYGDITPLADLWEFISVAEAFIGFAFITLTLSYLLNLYSVLQQVNLLTASLLTQARPQDSEHTQVPRPTGGDSAAGESGGRGSGARGSGQAGEFETAVQVLNPHFVDGQPRQLEERLQALHSQMLSYSEGLHRYPLVYYFHSRRPFGSLPYTFHLIGELLSALAWGLPAGHPVTASPWLKACIDSYLETAEWVGGRFVRAQADNAITPLGRQAFFEQVDIGPDQRDLHVRRFMRLQQQAHALVGCTPDWTRPTLHGQYCDWLQFVSVADPFMKAAAEDLGHGRDAQLAAGDDD